MYEELRKQHDELLTQKPENAVHNEEDCVFCSKDSEGGGDMKTYTEDEFNKAVAAAVAPVQAELDTIKSSMAEGEVEDRVAEIQAEADSKVSEAEGKLDQAVASQKVAEKTLEDALAYLEDVAKEAEKAAELEALRASRRQAIEDLDLYDEAFIDSKIDFWAGLSDDDFAALVDSIKVTVEKASEKTVKEGQESASSSVLDSTRDDVASAASKDDLGDILGARNAGFDIHSIY